MPHCQPDDTPVASKPGGASATGLCLHNGCRASAADASLPLQSGLDKSAPDSLASYGDSHAGMAAQHILQALPAVSPRTGRKRKKIFPPILFNTLSR